MVQGSRQPSPGSDDPVLGCRGLRKRYGDRTAVDGVGFTIARAGAGRRQRSWARMAPAGNSALCTLT